MKKTVIDVGGGLRGIFSAGVFDRMLEDQVKIDLGIGVSAGSGNLASFLAGQKGRNYEFYTKHAFTRKYMGLSRYLLKGSFVDLDYIYSSLSNTGADCPLDYPALRDNPAELIVVATDAYSGKVKYFTKDDISKDNYDVFKASSAVPGFCKPYMIGNIPYYDGGISDPVPVELAFSKGSDKVLLILTRPLSVRRKPGRDLALASSIRKRYYYAANCLENRADKYNDSIYLAKDYAREGKLLVISPDDTSGLGTFTKDKDALISLYHEAYEKAGQVKEFFSQ